MENEKVNHLFKTFQFKVLKFVKKLVNHFLSKVEDFKYIDFIQCNFGLFNKKFHVMHHIGVYLYYIHIQYI